MFRFIICLLVQTAYRTGHGMETLVDLPVDGLKSVGEFCMGSRRVVDSRSPEDQLDVVYFLRH
jgi:hypothetical protein